MEDCHFFKFGEIRLETLYYSTGTLAQFLRNLKICKKNSILVETSSNFLRNISTCMCINKNY